MENNRYVNIRMAILITGTFMFPLFTGAYSAGTTHPALTSETVKFFNLSYPELTLTGEEKALLMIGGKEEDKGTRALQHFYDPVYNRGLSIGKTFEASKNWAEDTVAQAGYNLNSVSNPLAGVLYGRVKEFYSSGTDYTWERAIYEYAWGDKERGLESLGHILHLIQDASVPAHTRNDPHPPIGELGSPYENWAAQFESNNIDVRVNKPLSPNQNLKDYFEKIADYSNLNFFSKDSIFSKEYKNPQVVYNAIEILRDGEQYEFGYAKINGLAYKVVRVLKGESDQIFQTRKNKYLLTDPDNLILSGYWRLLSKQAVLNGAGVIKLFFDEVEKERKTKRLYTKNRNWSQKLYDATARKLYNFTMSVYGGSVPYDELVDDSSQVAAAAKTKETKKIEAEQNSSVERAFAPQSPSEVVENTQTQESPAVAFVDNSGDKPEKGLTFLDVDVQNQNGAEEDGIGGVGGLAPLPYSHPPGFGGGGSSNNNNNSASDTTGSDNDDNGDGNGNEESGGVSEPEDTIPPDAPVITTPTTNLWQKNITEILFSGTAEATTTVEARYEKGGATTTATTTVDSIGDWAFTLQMNEGTTTISFTATDAAGNVSEATTTTGFVDSLAPDVTLTAEECENNSLAASGCLVAPQNNSGQATTTLNFLWSTTASDLAYFVLNENGAISTTTATSTSVTANDNATYVMSISAMDAFGNESATSTKEIEVRSMPVVINEIAWMGTTESSSDEWIELYNRSDKTISLDDWVLYAQDGVPYLELSGSVPAGGYYLIERTDDETISDISADLILPFSGVGSGSGLSNSSEDMVLAFVKNNATTTIDRAADWDDCIVYACGYSSKKRSMERVDVDKLGNDTSNWSTALGEFILNGTDAGGNKIKGTPKARNSASYLVSKNGVVFEDTTLVKAKSPYLIGRGGLTVRPNTTLTIEPGVVIKLVAPNEPDIVVDGTLIANGTAEDKVVFTALEDDEYGGDTNGDATTTSPISGSWKRILFQPTSIGSTLTHTVVRYGGRWFNNMLMRAAVAVDSADVTFNNVTIEKSKKHGLYLRESDSSITDSTFRNNNTDADAAGVYISGGAPTLRDNTFDNNQTGVYAVGIPGASITSNTFTGNIVEAVHVSGVPDAFSDNVGSGNGLNAIVIGDNSSVTSGMGTTTLSANTLPYLVRYEARVVASTTLAFESGVVVKGHDDTASTVGSIVVKEGAKLYSNNTSASALIFTSMHDDTVGGVTDSATTTPAAGDWRGIIVEEGGELQMTGFTLRYAGGSLIGGMTGKGGIRFVGKTPTSTIKNAVIENNYQYGIRLDGGAVLEMSNTAIQNHTESFISPSVGIYVGASTAIMNDITFSGNEVDITSVGNSTISCINCGSPIIK